MSQSFVQAGFIITRLKIESMLSNAGVPVTDEEAKTHSSENYFEFHIKLLLPPGKLQQSLTMHLQRLSAQIAKSAILMQKRIPPVTSRY